MGVEGEGSGGRWGGKQRRGGSGGNLGGKRELGTQLSSPTTVYATSFHLCIRVVKDVSAPLESICYLGPRACYIKENEIK